MSTKVKPNNIRTFLNQFKLMHFPPAQMMGDDDIFVYGWHTINGLMRINEEYGLIEIIAVTNDVPHNGKFLEFIEMLEKYQDDDIIKFGITEFFNSRLRSWFKRRGYVYHAESDTMFYKEILLT